MKVARWGNSLAVRLPRDIAEELDLKEGDEVIVTAGGGRSLQIGRDRRREEALEGVRAAAWPMPAAEDLADRADIYDRFGPTAPGRRPYDHGD